MSKIKSIKRLKSVIYLDFKARKVCPSWRKFFFNPLIRFQIILRVYEYLINTQKNILCIFFRFYFGRLSIRLGFSIPPNVFGAGLCIVHYGTIVVNPNAKIGKNCRLHVGVNIGGKAGFYSAEEALLMSPKIGANCYIGPGAKIFGPVVIGDNCSVGANAVVTKSFLTNGAKIVGIPAMDISKNED